MATFGRARCRTQCSGGGRRTLDFVFMQVCVDEEGESEGAPYSILGLVTDRPKVSSGAPAIDREKVKTVHTEIVLVSNE